MIIMIPGQLQAELSSMLSSSEFPWFRSALKMKVLLNEFGGGITFMFGLTCVYSTKSVFLTGKSKHDRIVSAGVWSGLPNE
jgi:hypothetical protein